MIAEPDRLTPEMTSFRLLALAFIRDYFARYGTSPSQGEIGAALGATRTRVRDALRSLARDGLILRTPGPRGITLPSMREEAIRQLRELGWHVDEDLMQASEAAHPPGDPHSTLHPPPELDYP